MRQLALSAMIITVLFTCGVFHVRAATAATYYVATTGNDANPGTQAQPFQTIRKGLSILRAGDTLYLRGGTYREGINYSSEAIPSGTSWSSAVTIASHPSETAILKPGGGTVLDLNATNRPTLQYLIFDHLILDAAGAPEGIFIAGAANYIRVQNSEIKNASGQGIQGGFGATNIEFINLKVHDNGLSRLGHGFYIAIPSALIEGCEVYNNNGYGIQIYDTTGSRADNTIVRRNRVHDNRGDGGVTLNYGDNIQFYNNIIYNNLNGVDISYHVTNTQVYNNTIYNHAGGINLLSGSSGAVIKNNILYQNSSAINDSGIGTVASNNLMIDPKFVDPSTANFHLQLTSPAIDAGVTLNSVQTDLDGTPRPQGSRYDIGAYEYQSRQLLPSPTNLRVLP